MTTITLESLPPRLRRFLPSIADFFGRSPSIVPPAMKVVALAVDAAARQLQRDRHGSVTQLDLARPRPDALPTELPVLAPAPALFALPMALNEASTELAAAAATEAVAVSVRDSTPEAATQPALTIVPDAEGEVHSEPRGPFPHAPLYELGPWYQAPPSPEQTLLAMREEELRAVRVELLSLTRMRREVDAQLVTERRQHDETRAERDLAMDRVGELEGIDLENARLRIRNREAERSLAKLNRTEEELLTTRMALEDTKKDLTSRDRELTATKRRCDRPQTPIDAVSLAEVLYPDRLVFSTRARKNAEDSAYRDGGLVFEVLSVIALTSKNPSELGSRLKSTFGGCARWRSSESKATAKAFAVSRRHTNVRGEATTLSEHITLGHGEKPGATLQIYVLRLGDGLIEIAHCGDHLETVAFDT